MTTIGGYQLAGLTGEVCESFESYHAGEVLEAIRKSRASMRKDEYAEAIQGHFRSVAAGDYDFGSENTTKILQTKKHLVYLIDLMLAAADENQPEEAALQLWEKYFEEIAELVCQEITLKNSPRPSEQPSPESSSADSALTNAGDLPTPS